MPSCGSPSGIFYKRIKKIKQGIIKRKDINMDKKSLTITGLIIMAVLFIAHQAGVNLTENELQGFLDVGLKLLAVLSWVVIYIKRLARGDVKILGSRKED